MNSKNIVFTEATRAELIMEPVREIKEHEVLVRLAVSSISSGTERANLIGSDSVNCTVAAKAATFPRRGGYSAAFSKDISSMGYTFSSWIMEY